jgi:hypothetical protein
MFRHGVSGLTDTWRETFPMLRQTFWRVRPGGLFKSKHVSTVTPLAVRVRLLMFGRLSRLAHCHAIARIATVVDDHLGYVITSVFTKASTEGAIHTTRCIGLQTILDCSLLSLDKENAFNTISRRSFLAQWYKNPVGSLHPIIPLAEMIYSRDSAVYYFDHKDASLLYGTVQSCTGVRQGDPLGPLLSTW